MSFARRYLLALIAAVGLGVSGLPANAAVLVQCPGDANGNAIIDTEELLLPEQRNQGPIACQHLSAGDGFVSMADGKLQYIFGFSNLTGRSPSEALDWGLLAAQFAAPTLKFKEGAEVYLTLSNAGTLMRPDLFDPHSLHYHGFPQASTIYDGEPEAGVSINAGSSLTYYYRVVEPGTFMYHCHVEAAEHMQMGMLGNLYVSPKQNGTPYTYGGKTYTTFVYNDGDGSTGYDVEFPIQIGSFDPVFHDLHLAVQPLPFALMKDTYTMLNGRGYPDTVNPLALPAPPDKATAAVLSGSGNPVGPVSSQPVSSLVQAKQGDTILLRISNLNVTAYYTLGVMGLKMKVVGTGAHILRGASGTPTYYTTNSVTLGGGESVDVLIDTTNVPAGTYFLYTTNLNFLSNNTEDFGGMMTEIVISNPAAPAI